LYISAWLEKVCVQNKNKLKLRAMCMCLWMKNSVGQHSQKLNWFLWKN